MILTVQTFTTREPAECVGLGDACVPCCADELDVRLQSIGIGVFCGGGGALVIRFGAQVRAGLLLRAASTSSTSSWWQLLGYVDHTKGMHYDDHSKGKLSVVRLGAQVRAGLLLRAASTSSTSNWWQLFGYIDHFKGKVGL